MDVLQQVERERTRRMVEAVEDGEESVARESVELHDARGLPFADKFFSENPRVNSEKVAIDEERCIAEAEDDFQVRIVVFLRRGLVGEAKIRGVGTALLVGGGSSMIGSGRIEQLLIGSTCWAPFERRALQILPSKT